MKIDSVRYESGELVLTTSSPEARKLAYRFTPGDYDLVKATKKRSLDANAYCWVLCSMIAQAVGITKEEVYQDAVREGDQYLLCCLSDEDSPSFVRAWESRGLGWRVDTMDNPGTGIKYVLAYYGSSVYDSKAMARLIDLLIQQARSLGLEVMPEEELRSLLEAWK